MSIKKIILYIVCVLYLPACSTSVSKRHMYNEQKEQKLSSTQYFKRIIKNYQKVNSRPLVIIAGSSMYKTQRGNFRNFPSVYEQIKNTTRVFRNNSKYTVVSNYKGHNNQSKKVSLNQLKNFIDKQVIYLRNNEKNYNSVIFIWYGKSYDAGIITSDNKQLKSEYIRQRLFEDSNIYDNIPEMEIINPKKELIINKKDNKDLDQIIFLDKQSKQKNLNQEDYEVCSESIYSGHLKFDHTPKSIKFLDNSKKLKNCLESLNLENEFRNYHDNIEISNLFNNIGKNCLNQENYDKALELLDKILSHMKSVHNNAIHKDIAKLFNIFAMIYEAKKNYKESLKFRLLALNIYKNIYATIDCPNINISLDSISTEYYILRDYVGNSKINLSSHNMSKHIRISEVIKDIVRVLVAVRFICSVLEDYSSSLEYNLEYFNLIKILHNNEVNKVTIDSIEFLAYNYYLLEDHHNTVKYSLETLRMKTLFRPNIVNNTTANLFYIVCFSLFSLKKYDEALKYGLDFLKIRKNIHGNLNTANECFYSLLDLFNSNFLCLQDYNKVLNFFLDALKIRGRFCKNTVDKVNIILFINIGQTYSKLGEIDKALKYLLEGHRLRKKHHICVSVEFIDISTNLIASMYFEKNQFKKSINYFLECLKARRIIYSNKPHKEIRVTLYLISILYSELKNYQDALKYGLENLEMIKTIHSKKPHKEILESLSLLRNIYHKMGDSVNELKYNLEIYNMVKDLSKNN